MIISYASHVAAGHVIRLLLDEGFLPIRHFRLSQAADDPNHVTITLTGVLSALYETELCADIAAIPNTRIQ